MKNEKLGPPDFRRALTINHFLSASDEAERSESTDITVRGIKSFSARPWSDGIDLMCCRRVRIERCFLRTSDDCIALYNHRWWFWGGSQDIVARGCVLWPDVAHSVNIGSHGDDRNPEGETLRDVLIEDCDVLQGIDGHGLLAVNCGDITPVSKQSTGLVKDNSFHSSRLYHLFFLKIWSAFQENLP